MMPNRSSWKIFKRLRLAFWILEIFECLFALAILGISGSSASGILNDLRFPNIPTKLRYNIVIAALTALVLLATVPLDLFRPDFWGNINLVYAPWPRAIINAIFTALWAGAIAASIFSCGDLCSAASAHIGYIQYASLCCNCRTDAYTLCINPQNLADVTVEPREYRYEATQALNAILCALFLASTFVLIAIHWFRAPTLPVQETGITGGFELENHVEHKHPHPMGKPAVADITKW